MTFVLGSNKLTRAHPYRFARLCQESGTGHVAVGGRLKQGASALPVGEEQRGAVLQEKADRL